jgi:hypothetical protein
VVADFDVASGDVLMLQGFGLSSFDEVMARTRQDGDHVLIDLGAEHVWLLNVDRATLNSDDFLFG